MNEREKWVELVIELQSLAQAGLFYGKDEFDKERYQRIREISAELFSCPSGVEKEMIYSLFCQDYGYQTPKIDTRAAIFEEDKILLVQEKNGKWSLPGGWVEVNLSVKENVIKEVREEAGLNVSVDKLIAVQDRDLHNPPPYAYKVCKMFFLCSSLGGQFEKNIETLGTAFYSKDALPEFAEEKCTKEQVLMCFEAYHSKDWTLLLE